MDKNLWSIIVLYLDYHSCERLSSVNRRLYQIINDDILWRLKFEQDYHQAHDLPTISWRDVCYRAQFKLFHVTTSPTLIPLLVHYITNDVIIDVFGHSYFITYDGIIHDLTSRCIGSIRECIHSVQHPYVFHITYINDRQELYNLAVKDTTHENILIRERVRKAAYAHNSAMVVVDEDQKITIISTEYVNDYSVVINDMLRRGFAQPWRSVNTSFSSPVASVVMSGSSNQYIGVITEEGKCYLLKTWLSMGNQKIVQSVEEMGKASHLVHFDCVIFAVREGRVTVISSYADKKKDVSCNIDYVEDIKGCVMISYQDKIYSLDNLSRTLTGFNYHYYYLTK